MDLIPVLLGGFGLAAAAGLNAWIPLALIGAAVRWLPGGWIELSPNYQFLAADWFLIMVVVLGAIEFLADKIPVVDHANDLLQTVIRPTAGAILFASSSGAVEKIDPRLGLALGFVAAGAVHGVKAGLRPLVTAATGGAGNPVVSFLEDLVSLVMALLAILLPLALILVFIGLPWLVVRWVARMRRRAGAMAEFDARS